jgi:hypothetical protein
VSEDQETQEIVRKQEHRDRWKVLTAVLATLLIVAMIGIYVSYQIGQGHTNAETNALVKGIATAQVNHTATINAIDSLVTQVVGEDADIKSLVTQMKAEQALQARGDTTVDSILVEAGATVKVLEAEESQALSELRFLCTKFDCPTSIP